MIMAEIESQPMSYSEFTSDAMSHAFEINAQAKSVWALLEDVRSKHPEIEDALTSVSFLLMAIERSSNQLAANISETEFKYVPAAPKAAL